MNGKSHSPPAVRPTLNVPQKPDHRTKEYPNLLAPAVPAELSFGRRRRRVNFGQDPPGGGVQAAAASGPGLS
jgi:hypothetical protein